MQIHKYLDKSNFWQLEKVSHYDRIILKNINRFNLEFIFNQLWPQNLSVFTLILQHLYLLLYSVLLIDTLEAKLCPTTYSQ